MSVKRGGEQTMLNTQRFTKRSHPLPLSVFKHSPADGFQIFTVPSELPLARILQPPDQATVLTQYLPFSNKSVLLVSVLRLSPAERGEGVGKPLLQRFCLRNETNQKRYPWPSSVAWHVPDDTSHILISVSENADTIFVPSGANLHAKTKPLHFFLNVREHKCTAFLRLYASERGRPGLTRTRNAVTCGPSGTKFSLLFVRRCD